MMPSDGIVAVKVMVGTKVTTILAWMKMILQHLRMVMITIQVTRMKVIMSEDLREMSEDCREDREHTHKRFIAISVMRFGWMFIEASG